MATIKLDEGMHPIFGLLEKLNSEERPDVNALYSKLSELTSKPVDLSPLKAVAAAAQEGGRRDFMGGLALSTLGGSRMSQLGKTLAAQGLEESKPLRPNAADVGYTNQETGEIINNPMMQHGQNIKALEHQTRSAEMSESKRLQVAQQLVSTLEASGRSQEANQIRMLIAQMARETSLTRALLAANKPGKVSSPTSTDKKLIQSFKEKAGSVGEILSSFDDKYAGKGAIGGPEIMLSQALGSWGSKSMQKEAEWWSNFQMLAELPQRHELFGSALTATEQQAWKAAQQINPRTDPAIVRATLGRMKAASDRVFKEYGEQLLAEGKTLSPAFTPPGSGVPPAAPGAPGLPSPAAIAAELARRKGAQ